MLGNHIHDLGPIFLILDTPLFSGPIWYKVFWEYDQTEPRNRRSCEPLLSKKSRKHTNPLTNQTIRWYHAHPTEKYGRYLETRREVVKQPHVTW